MLHLLDSHAFSDVHRTELFELVKEASNDITQAEVDEVMKSVQNQSPDGKVDFDEFLFALSEKKSKVTVRGGGEGGTSIFRVKDNTSKKRRRGVLSTSILIQ